MAENSHISWTDHTFNPWIGCTRISPACDGCYAAALMGGEGGRFNRAQWGGPGVGEGTRTRTKDWSKPRKWNRDAAAAPGQTFVFCASLADVFDNAVDPTWRRDLFDLIRATPNLTWLLLTKRPGNIVKMFREIAIMDQSHDPLSDYWPPNAAIGCTIVTQDEADRDVPKLLIAKAALKPAFAFLSMEPLLGRVVLTDIDTMRFPGAERLNALTGELTGMFGDPAGRITALDWVITGGETDQGPHKARPTHTDEFRELRDQCASFGVAYHHKQNGEWGPRDNEEEPNPVFRLGKVAAGRLLDGLEHNARPEVRRG